MPTTPSVTGINPAQSGMGLRLTPSNSPYYRASGSRSPSKLSRNWNEPSLLSLKRIIGITTASPNAFDCSESHKTLAYTAGAAAVVVKLDGGPCTSQRFFRARPTVVPSSVPASSTTPSTPNGPFAASRARSLVSTRDGGGSPLAPDSPMGDWGDSPSSRTWTARERIKAASCVSQSPNGKFLAVGETGYNPRVLNFSLADDSPQDKPLSAVAEHTFGICAVAFSPDSRGGTVFFWDAEGQKKRALSIELEQFPREDEDPLNELKVVQASPRCTFLVSGDKFGVLRIMDGVTGESHFYTKAHDSEIMDLAILETDSRTLVASCSRDRTIQLFHCINGNWTLAQTMGEHTSCVNRLLFWNDGETLISASADRTILIRKLASREVEGEAIIAFLPSQTLGLRAAPVSMAASPDEPDILVVSTLDRCIHRFQMSSGRNINTFRASDSENGDAVIIDSLMLGSTKATPTLSNLVIGTSTTDKSLRVYDQSGTLLSKEWGHTEGVSNAALVGSTSASSEQPSTTMLVSTGVDGTIMIYDIASKAQHVRRDSDDTEQSQDSPSTKDLTASRTPLRRVLSKSDLAEFQRNTAPTDIPPVPSLGNRSPPRTIRKKASNATLSQSTRLGLPFRGGFSGSENSPTPTSREIAARKARRDRSPSPPSPKAGSQPTGFKRPSLDARFRTKSAGNLTETGQLCQTLRAYRANLNNSPETPRPDNLKELERELKLTTKALAEKLMGPDKSEDVEVTKLLDDYSERLVGMIDEKLALGSRRKASGGFESLGLVTPPNAVGEG
ncbi:MAG: hypothetical protein M4579_005841 [Chaenotheca gracillima]|nr:MAG: hypothetical protein M4579_005841 [Chaenotheca gracillima]